MAYHDDVLSGRRYYARRLDSHLHWVLDRIADGTMGDQVAADRAGRWPWSPDPARNVAQLLRLASYARQEWRALDAPQG